MRSRERGAARPRTGPSGVAPRAFLAAAALIPAAWVAASCGGDYAAAPVAEPGEPLSGLDSAERGRFFLGRALFERLATADEGLGPLYNAERCSSCHDEPVTGGGSARVPVLKATRFNGAECDLLEAYGGDNIQRRATDLLVAHGMGAETVPAIASATARMVAPPLFGLGLVETVTEEHLAERADPDDENGDGISGRLPRGPDGRAARFGRKGDAATVEEFVDTALRFELGFTTPSHPREEPRNGQPVPAGADPMPDPEITAEALAMLADYVRFLAPPAPDTAATSATARDSVARGGALFRQIGCESCHREELHTGPASVPALASQTIRPYSDFLLHDLGPGLASVCGRDAAPAEIRTAPLWGLRHRRRLLHDGRAASAEAAVAAHGGEAAAVRDAFLALSPGAQADLLRFLLSL